MTNYYLPLKAIFTPDIPDRSVGFFANLCSCLSPSEAIPVTEIELMAKIVINVATSIINGQEIKNSAFVVSRARVANNSGDRERQPLLSPDSDAVFMGSVEDSDEREGNLVVFIIALHKFFSANKDDNYCKEKCQRLAQLTQSEFKIDDRAMALSNQAGINLFRKQLQTGLASSATNSNVRLSNILASVQNNEGAGVSDADENAAAAAQSQDGKPPASPGVAVNKPAAAPPKQMATSFGAGQMSTSYGAALPPPASGTVPKLP